MSGRVFLTSLFCTLSLVIFGFQVYNSKVRHHTSRGNLSLPYFERPLTSSTLSIWYRLGNLNTTRFHHIQNKRGRRARFFSSRIGYYSNSNATFQFERISVSGDVSPNPGPTTDSTRQATQSSRHELKCLYFNSRSVVNKTRELEVIASSKQYDLIAITETWLNDSISNNELLPSNKYYIHRRDREVPSRGGGVMLAVGSTLQSVRRTDLETNAEILVCEIRPEAKKKFLCVVFYRPPSSKSEYMNCFKNFLRKASKTHISQLVILGDFNFPDINWSTGTAMHNDCLHNEFTKMVRDNFLWQMVEFPTRGANILDLLLTNIPHKVKDVCVFDDILKTDHKLIDFNLSFIINKKRPVKRIVYNWKKADISGLKQSISRTPWDLAFDESSVNISVTNWMDLLLTITNEHVQQVAISDNNNKPWIDKEVIQMMHKKDRMRKIAKRTGDHTDIENFEEIRRNAGKLIEVKYKDYLNELKSNLTEHPKRFWTFIKAKTRAYSTPQFLKYGNVFATDGKDKANLLNSFFHSVFNSGVSPESSDEYRSEENCEIVDNSLSQIVLNESEVLDCLLNLDQTKTGGPDDISARLLKTVANEITPSLTRLFNLSLRLGEVPSIWKQANVTPVPKVGDVHCVENYRPISLLCIVSKVLEKCIYNRCYDSISGIAHHLQHGFLRGRNCTTQLIQVYHKILKALDNKHSVDVIYLDFQKAFDKVSHHLLLRKLSKHGFYGSIFNWFKSYLSGRIQRVALDGHYSEWLDVTSGVPQGSILGPLLFILYINDLPDQIQQPTEMALYADDSKLYRTIKSDADTENLQLDLNEMNSWTETWRMKFNTNKCKVMRLSRKKIQSHVSDYILGHESLELVKTTKDLGITVSDDVRWGKHIAEITAKANRTLGLIKRTCRDFEDQTVRKLLYLTLVRPQLEFSSELWS